MRISLRVQLLLLPLLLFAAAAIVTAYAAHSAAHAVDERILARIEDVKRTLRGPPTFNLTPSVLLQLENLTGMVLVPEPVAPGFQYHAITLPDAHPNAGRVIHIGYPTAQRDREIADAVRPVIVLGLGGGLLTSVIAYLLGRSLVARIRRIERGTRSVAAGAFTPLPQPSPNDELRDLAASINEMIGRLQQAERSHVLNLVAGGLAHQLRNAATGAKLAVQLAPSCEPLEVAQRQLERMESILRQFLDLARPEPRAMELHDLRDVIDHAVTLVTPQARHLNTRLIWSRPTEGVMRTIDIEAMEHLLENLLTNAIEAAGPDGTVRINVTRSEIIVVDHGPGPPQEVAARLFEPFVTSKPGGIGLGLMVAKQAAERHGATLTWKRNDVATIFRIRWP